VRSRSEPLLTGILLIADAAALAVSFVLAYWLRTHLKLFGYTLPPFRDYVRVLSFILPTFVAWLTACGLYRSSMLHDPLRLIGALAKAWFLSMLTVLSILYTSKEPALSRFVLDTFALISIAALIAERFGVRAILNMTAARQREGGRWEVLLVAELAEAEAYLSLLRAHPHWGVEVAAIISPTQGVARESVSVGGRGSERVIKRRVDWRRMLENQVIDEVVAVSEWSDQSQLAELQQVCAARGLVFSILVMLPYPRVGRYTVDDVGAGRYLVSLETVPQDVGPLAVKRAMDVAGALFGLVACGMVYLWYARKLRRESPGPVLFSQQRTGRNGRPFRCHKFRTMIVDAERQQKEFAQRSKFGAAFCKVEDDPRIIPTGAWMRRHYLDELPQFWNVLRGEMSLVGPRPSPVIEATYYIDRQRRRLSMKPGITGLFQINGHQAVDDFESVVELDCAYIDNWSLLLDLKIILKTVGKIAQADAW
jgi:exopolysaccharide biosynthesis polyprenyl glycosylphosphotransferase